MKALITTLLIVLAVAAYAQDLALPSDVGTVGGNTPTVTAGDAHLLYTGRFERGNPNVAECEWSNSEVKLKFSGTGARAILVLRGNRVLVTVDGQPTKMLTFDESSLKESVPRSYVVADRLPTGEHEVALTKVTEAFYGPINFHGFEVDGEALPVTPPVKRILVVGDSISAAAGNESIDRNEHMNPNNQNAWLSYGAITARAFDAGYTAIVWSGRKLWPDNTITEIYNRTLPTRASSLWPGDALPPDVIVVNLCANDFLQQNPDEESWVKAYHALLDELRKEAPKALIYCGIGPAMHDYWPPGRNVRSTAMRYIERVVNEKNASGGKAVRFIDFGVQDENVEGIGADWHPTVKMHQRMAETLTSAIERDLSWQRK